MVAVPPSQTGLVDVRVTLGVVRAGVTVTAKVCAKSTRQTGVEVVAITLKVVVPTVVNAPEVSVMSPPVPAIAVPEAVVPLKSWYVTPDWDDRIVTEAVEPLQMDREVGVSVRLLAGTNTVNVLPMSTVQELEVATTLKVPLVDKAAVAKEMALPVPATAFPVFT